MKSCNDYLALAEEKASSANQASAEYGLKQAEIAKVYTSMAYVALLRDKATYERRHPRPA